MPTDNRNIFTELDHAGRPVLVLSKNWPDGTRFRRRMPNLTVAKKVRSRIEEALAMGTWKDLKKELYNDEHAMTVKEFSDVYMKEYARVRNSRPDFKEETLEVINRIVGHIRVKDFKRSDAKMFETTRAAQMSQKTGKPLAGSTVNRGLSVLSSLLTFAMDKGLISQHPMVRFRYIKEERRPPKIMTVEQERAIVNGLLEYDSIVGVYFGLLGETALRMEEGLRLEWQYIDQSARILTVHEAKSKKPRHIPLSDFAMELLGQAPRIIGNPYVMVRLETMSRMLDPVSSLVHIRKSLGLDWVNCRSFRHFRATQWVSLGIDLVTVKELLGHSDIKTTMIYAHYAPKHAMRAIIEAQRREAEQSGDKSAASE